jgi:hypothetical protein
VRSVVGMLLYAAALLAGLVVYVVLFASALALGALVFRSLVGI